MKSVFPFLFFLLTGGAYVSVPKTTLLVPDVVLVGSTPGDSLMKAMLAIPAETSVDFIRWELSLAGAGGTFTLHLLYGESQPNTLGFKGGGEKRSLSGTYAATQSGLVETYQLQSTSLPFGVGLVRLNENLFHLLTPEQRLMNGNGGWSYTLARKAPVQVSQPLPRFAVPSSLFSSGSHQVIFDGRTPCSPIAAENNITASPGCFKLKWRLILNRDSLTRQPGTYTLRRVVNRAEDRVGRWMIRKGDASNPDVRLLILDPDNPEKRLSLLVGDENVLFFLNKNNELYVGNADFSFTLNRKIR